jgi:nicotinamide riboside kinase
MKICITGSQGVGKTTLAQQINKEFPEFQVLPEAARLAVEAGYSLDLDATMELEMWLILKQIELEKATGDWVADRCFIDLVAYISYLFRHQDALIEVAQRIIGDRLKGYDLVLYLPVEFEIKADGVRFVDKKFQSDVDKIVEWLLHRYDIRFHRITGNPKERLTQVKKLIKEARAEIRDKKIDKLIKDHEVRE